MPDIIQQAEHVANLVGKPRKLYAVAIMATKMPTTGGYITSLGGGWIRTNDLTQARQEVIELFLVKYPEHKDSNISVDFTEIPLETQRRGVWEADHPDE